jgi:ubiquinone/menaquinone biosynthesis C-methylase UbiE
MRPVLRFDEAVSHRVQASYVTPEMVEQRRVVRAALNLQPGEDVLDIGSGPGLLAYEMAAEVGPHGSVRGIDPSDSMLAIAQRRQRPAIAAPVAFATGDAAALPFANDTFDAVVATQVYEYVSDVPLALGQAHRVLRPAGRLLILDTDWDSIVWHSSEPDRMQRVLAAWDEHIVDPYLPRRLTPLLEDAGFVQTRCTAFPVLNAGYDPNAFSASLIDMIAAFIPGRRGLTEADAAAWTEDLSALGRDYFFSLNRYLFLAVK